jgi:hypothetical protein
LGPIGNEWCEFHHPSGERGLVNRDAALRKDLSRSR